MIKQPSAVVLRDMEKRIRRLDQLAEQRRALLETKFQGTEHREMITNAALSTSDKAKIEDELARIEAESAGLKTKLAAMKAAMPPEDPAKRKELDKAKAEGGRQFKKLLEALSAAGEAGKQYQETRKNEAALRSQLDGIPDYWRHSKHGLITEHILLCIEQLFQDIRLVDGK